MIKASQIVNNESKKQNDLFVDSSNVNLLENGGVRASQAKKKKQPINFLPFVLMIALSVHSIFEGLALGLMQEIKPFINLMVSILVHKFAEAMSISIAM
jgi:zinc transporter 1/2/3